VRIIAPLFAIAVSACGAAPAPPPETVNLVILSIDTLRPDHLGVYGYPRETSPNLDRFADRGVVFDQAITVHVATAPAHGTILTGRYPASHGIRRNGMHLAPDVPTLAETFAARGSATGGFVSGWTLERHTGLDRGFDTYDDALGAPGAGARRKGATTTKAALKWLRRQVAEGREFFLFLHLFEPHWPYDPPPRDALRFLSNQYELTTVSKPVHLDRRLDVNRLTPLEQREYVARYDGEIVVADRLLGRLLDGLDDLGVAHNTVVLVLSDHGETLFEREWTMDHGTRPYDEQARVPLLLAIPGDPNAGRRVAEQVSLLDVAPTLLEVFGIAAPDGLQGRSLLPLVRGEPETDRRPAFITARSDPRRVPHLGVPLSSRGLVRAVRLPGLKLIEYPTPLGGRHPELFVLSDDPGERRNRATQSPESAAALHRELAHWQVTSGADPLVDDPVLDPATEAALRELGYLDD
jgi:arylsulfatase A-like enzyme